MSFLSWTCFKEQQASPSCLLDLACVRGAYDGAAGLGTAGCTGQQQQQEEQLGPAGGAKVGQRPGCSATATFTSHSQLARRTHPTTFPS